MRETDFTRQFSKLLREARIASGMSQEQLANQAGVHRTHISLIERSRRSVRLETRALEKWFKAQENKWHESGGRDINNPKIPLTLVRRVGTLVFETDVPA